MVGEAHPTFCDHSMCGRRKDKRRKTKGRQECLPHRTKTDRNVYPTILASSGHLHGQALVTYQPGWSLFFNRSFAERCGGQDWPPVSGAAFWGGASITSVRAWFCGRISVVMALFLALRCFFRNCTICVVRTIFTQLTVSPGSSNKSTGLCAISSVKRARFQSSPSTF